MYVYLKFYISPSVSRIGKKKKLLKQILKLFGQQYENIWDDSQLHFKICTTSGCLYIKHQRTVVLKLWLKKMYVILTVCGRSSSVVYLSPKKSGSVGLAGSVMGSVGFRDFSEDSVVWCTILGTKLPKCEIHYKNGCFLNIKSNISGKKIKYLHSC